MILRHSDYIRGCPPAQIQSHNYACQYVLLVLILHWLKHTIVAIYISVTKKESKFKILNPKHDHSGKNGLPSTPPSCPCHLYSNLISMELGILSELNIITIKNTKTQAHPIGVLWWHVFCRRNTSNLLPSKQTAIIRPHSRFFISFPNVGEHQFPSINHKLATLDTPSWRNHSPCQCWGLKLHLKLRFV